MKLNFNMQMYIALGALLLLIILLYVLLVLLFGKYKKLKKMILSAEQEKVTEKEEPKAAEEPVAIEELEKEMPVEINEADITADELPIDELDVSNDTFSEIQNQLQAKLDATKRELEKYKKLYEESVQKSAVEVDEEKEDVETIEKTELPEEIIKKIDEIAEKQRKSFDKIKVVRYNQKFEDGSPKNCYSIGITNEIEEGIVLTGIATKDGATNLVVKSVKKDLENKDLTEAEACAVKRK